MSKNTVYFASAHLAEFDEKASLPFKFGRLLEKYDLVKMCSNKNVAIKMHLGNGVGTNTIHQLYVKILVDAVKKAGGRPFLTDCGVHGPERGYTQEVVGAAFRSITGADDKDFTSVPFNYRNIKEIYEEIKGK